MRKQNIYDIANRNVRSSTRGLGGVAEYLTYVASVGEQEDSIEMRYEDENIWLTQMECNDLLEGNGKRIMIFVLPFYKTLFIK